MLAGRHTRWISAVITLVAFSAILVADPPPPSEAKIDTPPTCKQGQPLVGEASGSGIVMVQVFVESDCIAEYDGPESVLIDIDTGIYPPGTEIEIRVTDSEGSTATRTVTVTEP